MSRRSAARNRSRPSCERCCVDRGDGNCMHAASDLIVWGKRGSPAAKLRVRAEFGTCPEVVSQPSPSRVQTRGGIAQTKIPCLGVLGSPAARVRLPAWLGGRALAWRAEREQVGPVPPSSSLHSKIHLKQPKWKVPTPALSHSCLLLLSRTKSRNPAIFARPQQPIPKGSCCFGGGQNGRRRVEVVARREGRPGSRPAIEEQRT